MGQLLKLALWREMIEVGVELKLRCEKRKTEIPNICAKKEGSRDHAPHRIPRATFGESGQTAAHVEQPWRGSGERKHQQGGSKKPLPISTKAPPQANQLPMVEGEDWSSEGEFEEEDKVDENGESSNEDEGEQGKGEIEQNGLPDGFYLVEAVRKKRVRQVGIPLN
nr:hypothetical protein Iba_chr04fCG11570 [Ipomoea batatas]